MRVFLIFIVAHLVGDFLLQTRTLINRKRAREPQAFLEHALIHLVLAVMLQVLIGSFSQSSFLLSVFIALSHGLVDYWGYPLREKGLQSGTLGLLLDQLIHLGIIFLLGYRLAPYYTPSAVDQLLGILISLLLIIRVAGIIIGSILDDFRAREKNPIHYGGDNPAIGRYIGYLERGMILYFLYSGSPASIALLATFKTIARYKKLEEQSFAEYYLLGTMLSLSAGILGSFLIRFFTA